MKYIKWLWHRAGDAKGSVSWNILLACISIGLNLFFIWLSKSLVDIATGARTGSTLKLFAAILVATMLVRVFVNAARARLESNSVYKMQFIIRKDLFEGLIREQWSGKERFHSGDAVSRLFTDVDVVSKVICQDLPALIITIIQLAAAFVFLCTMDAKLAIILLLITPAFAAFGKIFFRRMRKLTKDIRESESNVQSHIQETLQHKTVVQSMGQELSMEEKLGGLQDTEYNQVQCFLTYCRKYRFRFRIFRCHAVGSFRNMAGCHYIRCNDSISATRRTNPGPVHAAYTSDSIPDLCGCFHGQTYGNRELRKRRIRRSNNA